MELSGPCSTKPAQFILLRLNHFFALICDSSLRSQGVSTVNLKAIVSAGLAVIQIAAASPGSAAPLVSLDTAVFVEHQESGDVRRLEPAQSFKRGDRVVTIVRWRRLGGSNGGFTLVNPLPHAIAYQASASDSEEVSTDGGRNWGQIGTLRFGNRLATPEDVTHVRWRVPATSAAAGRGQIAYSGIVR